MKVETELGPGATLPTYAHKGDAGADIYASQETTIQCHRRAKVPTGLKVAIPDGHVGLLWSRSGLADKHGITVEAGVIDSGYRGEVMVLVYNHTSYDLVVSRGERIAQLLVVPVVRASFELGMVGKTERGEGGFGSTGK